MMKTLRYFIIISLHDIFFPAGTSLLDLNRLKPSYFWVRLFIFLEVFFVCVCDDDGDDVMKGCVGG